MNVARSVRQIYEKRPYPAVDKLRKLPPAWRIVPLEWIDAVCPDHTATRRILVAGCGTGNEAFAFRKQFPDVEITAVDFSPRSIAMAKDRQTSLKGRKIKFRSADLTSARFVETVDGPFDIISCHGVLSYIPNSERAVKNMRKLLTPDGLLYLGVNGARHFSETWRPVLRDFSYDTNHFVDSPEARRFLKLCDALADHARLVSNQPAEFLAGDLFGPLINNRSLDEWIELAQGGGLHFRGSYGADRSLRRIFNEDLYDMLIPRSRAEAHRVAERLAPSRFHRLVFTRARPAKMPWLSHERLLKCRARTTALYQVRLPRTKKKKHGLNSIRLASTATNTVVDLRAPSWVPDILRQQNAAGTIGETLRGRRVAPDSLRQQLYLLELLCAINLSAVT
jgi:SAM-dependent methyltransferase